MEFWKEEPGGGEVELHAGFFTLTHRNDRSMVPGAAEEIGMMVLLEKVGSGSGKPEAGYCFPGRDAGDGENGGINLGVEIEEGGKVGR